jgi:hypothetical protein
MHILSTRTRPSCVKSLEALKEVDPLPARSPPSFTVRGGAEPERSLRRSTTERAGIVVLCDGTARPAIDSESVKARIVGGRLRLRLLGFFPVRRRLCGDKREVAEIGGAAARASLEQRKRVLGCERALETIRRAAPRTEGRREMCSIAIDAGRLEHALDERLAVVGPFRFSDGLAALDGKRLRDVRLKFESMPAAFRASAVDEPLEVGRGEGTHGPHLTTTASARGQDPAPPPG